jgi:hypothetical protein
VIADQDNIGIVQGVFRHLFPIDEGPVKAVEILYSKIIPFFYDPGMGPGNGLIIDDQVILLLPAYGKDVLRQFHFVDNGILEFDLDLRHNSPPTPVEKFY